MSSIYITEPPTKGKVVLHTTVGDLDIELWPKETPKACRNFVQLCLEGYYDNTIFHRIIKGFIVQGGDPTGTGFGGESIYGAPFIDEFHSRLRFSHRGIVAMATSEVDENKSQFFFTLDKAPELQNKHTIFGKITGDTIFNLLKFNDFVVDENEKPLIPPKITSIDVVSNPFDDIVPREKKANEKQETKKQKIQKNLNLLSFGDEAEEEEEKEETKIKMKSSAFFSDNPESKKSAEEAERLKNELKKSSGDKRGIESESKEGKIKKRKLQKPTEENGDTKGKEEEEDLDMNELFERQKRDGDEAKLKALQEEQKKLKKEIMGMKKKEADEKQEKIMSALEEQRAKYLEKKKGKSKLNEFDILNQLNQFTSQLRKTETSMGKTLPQVKESKKEEEAPQIEEEKKIDPDNLDDGKEDNWMDHKLTFEKESKVKDPSLKQEEEYVTFDPLKYKNVKPMSQHKKRNMIAGTRELL